MIYGAEMYSLSVNFLIKFFALLTLDVNRHSNRLLASCDQATIEIPGHRF